MKPVIVTEFGKEFNFNDKTLIANIQISYTYDEWRELDNFDFESHEEMIDFHNKLDSGKLSILVLKVKATWHTLEGHDSMGSCIISNPSDIDVLVNEYSMVDSAISDLVVQMKDIQNLVKNYL